MKRVLVVAACVLSSCTAEAPPPEGQWVLHVDTDAPVPAAPGEAPRTVTLFDSLRIDILSDGREVPGVSREFAIDERVFREGRASIGVVGAPGRSDLSARVRLYRHVRQVRGEPQPRTTIETTVRLPPIPVATVGHLAVTLRTDDVGRARGYPEPLEPEPFTGAPSRVGSWKYGARVPCRGEAAANEACVPGGAYWFGGHGESPIDDGLTLKEERLTVVGPFFIDTEELTLATFQTLAAADPSIGPRLAGSDCVFLPELPVDCVGWEAARAVCAARGMQLPTEAQWEWVASGLGNEWEWPWGDEAPSCGDAAFGTGAECPTTLTVAPPARYPRDRVTPIRGGPSIFDLAGNVSEWTVDRAVRPDQPPWSAVGVLVDPVGESDELPATRGASVLTELASTRVSLRRENNLAGDAHLGFRCVRSAR